MTPARLLSVRLHVHTHTPLTVRMPLVGLDRVTSSAPCSASELPAPPASWHISAHLHDIRCPLPTSRTPPRKPGPLFAFHVAMKMAWKWFVEKDSKVVAGGGLCAPPCTCAFIPSPVVVRCGYSVFFASSYFISEIFRLKIYSHLVCLVGKLKDFCAGLVNCSFGASGEDKREEVFIIWEEKRRDPFTAIMFQEVECWPHL